MKEDLKAFAKCAWGFSWITDKLETSVLPLMFSLEIPYNFYNGQTFMYLNLTKFHEEKGQFHGNNLLFIHTHLSSNIEVLKSIPYSHFWVIHGMREAHHYFMSSGLMWKSSKHFEFFLWNYYIHERHAWNFFSVIEHWE